MDRHLTKVLALPSGRAAFLLLSRLLMGPTSLVVLAAAAWCAGSSDGKDAATSHIVLTDPWNMPVALSMIPAGAPTLFYVCDPSEVRCREGAVYFDSKRRRFEESKIKPVCVLVGSREAAREAAARMGLSVPVYVDAGRTLSSKLIGQEIMPALVLLDGKGNLVKVIVGGGEALDNNITTMIEARPGGHRVVYAVLITLVMAGAIILAVD